MGEKIMVMESENYIPDYVSAALAGVHTDFIVKAKRKTSGKSSWFLFLFSIFWLGLSGFMLSTLLVPLLSGENVPITVNGVHKVANLHNIKPLMFPLILLSIFIIIGLILLFVGILMLLRKGDYFAGTKDFLYIINEKGIRKIDWEQFSGDIVVKGNNENGTIILGMRTGQMQFSSELNRSYYVQNKIEMVGIPNVYTIQNILTKRIKENDPTPSSD